MNRDAAAELLRAARRRLSEGTTQESLPLLEEAEDTAKLAESYLADLPQRLEELRASLAEEEEEEAQRQQSARQQEPADGQARAEEPDADLPASLLQALDAYLAGEYERASALLENRDLRPARARAAAHLVRAAAEFALWRMNGATDELQRETVTTEIRACKRLDRDLSPDPRAFSPVFIEVFQGVR
jgi:hypothetical protein